MNILFWVCLLFGIMSLLYYFVIMIHAGFGSTFSWFWIAAGLGSILMSMTFRYLEENEIMIPSIWSYMMKIIFLVGSSAFATIVGILLHQSRQKAEQEMDYLVVLGAQIRGTRITKSLKKRLDTAITYLNSNSRTIVIVSGGKGVGEMITEAEAMKQYLVVKGVESSRIIKEDKSTNTNENIRYSKLKIKENTSVAIVTNGFHMFRATSIAKKQGISQVQGLAAPTDRLLSINYYVREVAGVIKDKLYGNL